MQQLFIFCTHRLFVFCSSAAFLPHSLHTIVFVADEMPVASSNCIYEMFYCIQVWLCDRRSAFSTMEEHTTQTKITDIVFEFRAKLSTDTSQTALAMPISYLNLTTSQNEYISIFALGTVISNAYFSVNKSLQHYKSNNKMCFLLFIPAHSLSSNLIDSKCNSFLGRHAIVHRFTGSCIRSPLEQFCFEKFSSLSV